MAEEKPPLNEPFREGVAEVEQEGARERTEHRRKRRKSKKRKKKSKKRHQATDATTNTVSTTEALGTGIIEPGVSWAEATTAFTEARETKTVDDAQTAVGAPTRNEPSLVSDGVAATARSSLASEEYSAKGVEKPSTKRQPAVRFVGVPSEEPSPHTVQPGSLPVFFTCLSPSWWVPSKPVEELCSAEPTPEQRADSVKATVGKREATNSAFQPSGRSSVRLAKEIGDLQSVMGAASVTTPFIPWTPSADNMESYGGAHQSRMRHQHKYQASSVSLAINTEMMDMDPEYSDIQVLYEDESCLSAMTNRSQYRTKFKDAIFVSESSADGFVCAVLHCMAGAISSVMTGRQLSRVPKDTIVFYLALTMLTSSMPGSMHTKAWPFAPLHLQPLIVIRSTLIITTNMCKAMALKYIHVTHVVAINALVPVGVTFGSWLFLHEKIHKLQWMSIGMTMIGVLIVVRPVGLSLNVRQVTGVLFAIGSVMASIQLMMVARYVRHLTVRKFGFNGSCLTLGLSVLVNMVTGNIRKLFRSAFLGSLVLMSQLTYCSLFFLGKALEKESAVVVTALKFCGDIVFSMTLEAAFFGTYPDFWTCAGAGVILLAVLLMGYDRLEHIYGIDTLSALYNVYNTLHRLWTNRSPETCAP